MMVICWYNDTSFLWGFVFHNKGFINYLKNMKMHLFRLCVGINNDSLMKSWINVAGISWIVLLNVLFKNMSLVCWHSQLDISQIEVFDNVESDFYKKLWFRRDVKLNIMHNFNYINLATNGYLVSKQWVFHDIAIDQFLENSNNICLTQYFS